MEGKRENNYDLLRLTCSIAIISTHVSAMYMNAVTQREILGECYLNHVEITCMYNVLSRFAVPCFLMLSGAFLLADERNEEYGYFYKKTFDKIGLPTVIFSVIYFLYSFIRKLIYVVTQNAELTALLPPIEDFFKGKPYYHMWYMYMLLVIFILVPVIVRTKRDIGEKTFEKVAWVFLVLACLSSLTSTYDLAWDVGQAFCYMGYFMVGYVIRKKTLENKNNRKGICLLALGFVIGLLPTYIRYEQIMENKYLEYEFIDSYSPLILIVSLLIFAGMSMMVIKTDFHKFSYLTFLVYLLHAGIWDLIAGIVIMIFGTDADSRVIIPLNITLVFVVSVIFAALYIRLWKRLRKL